MKKLVLLAVVGAFGVAVSAGAEASTYTADATHGIPSWLDTGITALPGSTYQFSVVDPTTLWSAGSDIPFPRSSTADGINPVFYGTYTQDGFTANYGALVGEDATHFFLIGTGPIAITGLSGDIKVGYWDSFYDDNSGSQTLNVSAVPEPSTWAMMLLGFLSVGFLAYRRQNGAMRFT
jgi:hypothetical protein